MVRTYSCDACGFTNSDTALLLNHSCDVENNGGACEDYPCCGHEPGDCNGQRYGSDEAIKRSVERAFYDEDYAYAMEKQAEYDDFWR